METITLLMFLMVFALCVIFSIFSVMLEKVEWDLLAMALWFAFGLVNIGLAADEIFYSFSMLYWVLGMVFMVFAWKDVYLSFVRRRREEEEEEQWTVE